MGVFGLYIGYFFPVFFACELATLIRSKYLLSVSAYLADMMDGDSESDFAVSDSVTSPARLTSTPRASHNVEGRQRLSESGIRNALELTVSTIIESEDSDALGSDTDISDTTSDVEDNTQPPPPTPVLGEYYIYKYSCGGGGGGGGSVVVVWWRW